ncbi:MAG: hypothetical protein V3U87_11435 [Methylococcaceae bacterium]
MSEVIPRVSNLFYRAIKKYPFEFFIAISLLIYTGFYCTPSSYGHVLSLLGMDEEGLYFGYPKRVRSDEWAVWTPYMQGLVANDFERFNKHSIYHEDFRNFNALPIYDWALIFKPQLWSFLVLEPARAFSFHHGFIITAFLTGWKRFVGQLMGKHLYASQSCFVLFSFLLFFSSFVQMWWTTLGPLLAFFPWLMIVLFSWKKNSFLYYFALFYSAIVWVLAHTYPPGIISCAYLGFFLMLIYQPTFFTNSKRLLLTLVSFAVAIAVFVFYLSDAIDAMTSTVYPGQRVSMGGEVPLWGALFPIFFPYQYYSGYTGLIKAENVCEISSISSLLPLIVLCFTSYQKMDSQIKRELSFLFFSMLFIFCWIVLPIPAEWGKYLLLTSVPSFRMIFVFGLLVNLLALAIFLNNSIQITWQRLIVFSGILVLFWAMPGNEIIAEKFIEMEWFKKSATELVTIPLLIIAIILLKYSLLNRQKMFIYMLFLAAFVNGIYFANFNPLQSAKPIFEAQNSSVLNPLRRQQQLHSRGWLVSSVAPGAVLSGLGFKSFTHVLIQPQLAFFRKMFPELPEDEFNHIFNRYAHIQISDVEKPFSPLADRIRIPYQHPVLQK